MFLIRPATPFWPVRVLLDENLPRTLVGELRGHRVSTVQAEGWSGTKNGELLWRAHQRFDALLTRISCVSRAVKTALGQRIMGAGELLRSNALTAERPGDAIAH